MCICTSLQAYGMCIYIYICVCTFLSIYVYYVYIYISLYASLCFQVKQMMDNKEIESLMKIMAFDASKSYVTRT